MTTLVTGSAGFIGSHVVKKLTDSGEDVVGLDNHNDYYDPGLKESRVRLNQASSNYVHLRCDLAKRESLERCFKNYNFDYVINLAAQAGVRYSIENPLAYVDSNIVGFLNILECCKAHSIKHLVYASSSSVYGLNASQPFSIRDNVDHPLSIYAATKKSNELMAHAYSHLFDLPTSGLRFFTVYGPWGRPDMALFKFTKAIINGETIQVYNNGDHQRDFTYIDDIVEGIVRIRDYPPERNTTWDAFTPDPGTSSAPWRVCNIGNSQPVQLMDYIEELQNSLGRVARIEHLELQPGDVQSTYAEIDHLQALINYKPRVDVREGIQRFVEWYKEYFGC